MATSFASPECRQAADLLVNAGYAIYDEDDKPSLVEPVLTAKLAKYWVKRLSLVDEHLRDPKLNSTLDEFMEDVLPGGYAKVYEDVEPAAPVGDTDRVTADNNWRVLTGILWGNFSRTAANGKVQARLIEEHSMLLIEAEVSRSDNHGHQTKLKGRFCTRNVDWIITWYVDASLSTWVSGGRRMRSNLQGAMKAVPASTERILNRAGLKVDEELAELVGVSRPSLHAAADRLGLKVITLPGLGRGDHDPE